jgi:hypothetical protein
MTGNKTMSNQQNDTFNEFESEMREEALLKKDNIVRIVVCYKNNPTIDVVRDYDWNIIGGDQEIMGAILDSMVQTLKANN